MKVSALVAALTAELIRGNDAEIGFTVPIDMSVSRDAYMDVYVWGFNGFHIQSRGTGASGRGPEVQFDHKPNNAEFRHREDGVMEIVLT